VIILGRKIIMNLRLFLLLCLIAIPLISNAQSFDDPLGQINTSVHNVSKDWIKYLAIVLFVIVLFIFFLRRKFSSLVILLGAVTLILFIIWVTL
jgi:small-conductance mechanosensitive channel